MKTRMVHLAVLVMALVSGRHGATQEHTWPAPRAGGHALAFDSRRGLTMLYGDRGMDATVLWGWDGQRWTSLSSTGPGLRRHVKMAYDQARDRLVLYGGLDDSGRTFMSDTWEWDGVAWTRVSDRGPGPRASYSLVYDSRARRVLLFGGLGPDGAHADLWSWNGDSWSKVAEGGPTARGEAGMIVETRSGLLLITSGTAYEAVSGGDGRIGWSLRRGTPLRDTWGWNGRAWAQLADRGPARAFTVLVHDPITGTPLRIGGESPEGYQGDVSRWDGHEWRTIPDAEIPPRHGVAAALDSRRRRVVVFGGSSGSPRESKSLNDVWEWDGTVWRQTPEAK